MFQVYSKACQNCLLSNDAIVSSERVRQIIAECKKNQQHFICHNSSANDGNVCCKMFYDKLGQHSQIIRIAERLNAIEFVEQENDKKLTSCKEMYSKK